MTQKRKRDRPAVAFLVSMAGHLAALLLLASLALTAKPTNGSITIDVCIDSQQEAEVCVLELEVPEEPDAPIDGGGSMLGAAPAQAFVVSRRSSLTMSTAIASKCVARIRLASSLLGVSRIA